jgi:hypothetical protein
MDTELAMLGRGAGSSGEAEKDLDGGFADFVRGLMDSGQGRVDDAGEFDVVEADDGDVFGDAAAGLDEFADDAEGHDVVGGEDGGDVGVCGEEFLSEFGADGEGVGAKEDDGFDGAGADGKRAHEAFGAGGHAAVAARSAEVGDAAVAQASQVFGGERASVFVIGGDCAEGVAGRGVVEQDDGDSAGGEALLLFLVESPDGVHEDAVDALFEERFDVLHLFGVIEIAVAENEVAGTGAGGVFGSAGYFGEEGVADIADDQREGVGAAGDEGTGDTVWPVAETFSDGADALAGLIAYAVDTAESAGNGGDVDAGLAGDIADSNFFWQAFSFFMDRVVVSIGKLP